MEEFFLPEQEGFGLGNEPLRDKNAWKGLMPYRPADGYPRLRTLERRYSDPPANIALLRVPAENGKSGPAGEAQVAAGSPVAVQKPGPAREEDPNQRHLYEEYTENEYEWPDRNYKPETAPYRSGHEDIRLDPRRAIMRQAPQALPPQMDIQQNIKEALEARKMPLPSRHIRYKRKVETNDDWDYKTQVSQAQKDMLKTVYGKKVPFESAGNYLAGFMGAIAGILPELLHRGAGGYQIWEHGFTRGQCTPVGGPPYGDDPKDQFHIERGIQDAQRYLQLRNILRVN